MRKVRLNDIALLNKSSQSYGVSLRLMESQCYQISLIERVLLDTSEHTLSCRNPSHTDWYSIHLPHRDGRLSWPIGGWLYTERIYPPIQILTRQRTAGSRTRDLLITDRRPKPLHHQATSDDLARTDIIRGYIVKIITRLHNVDELRRIHGKVVAAICCSNDCSDGPIIYSVTVLILN